MPIAIPNAPIPASYMAYKNRLLRRLTKTETEKQVQKVYYSGNHKTALMALGTVFVISAAVVSVVCFVGLAPITLTFAVSVATIIGVLAPAVITAALILAVCEIVVGLVY